MTVKELRDVLVAFEDDTPVLVSSYEGERYDDVGKVALVEVFDRGAERKKRAWWTGRYEDAFYREDEQTFDAVVIPR